MKRPDELTREYLKRLEEQLPNNKKMLRLMNTVFLEEMISEMSEEKKGSADRVGIWKKKGEQYSLDESMASEWNFWAKMSVIPNKSSKKRVIFLGESVARGYFYDPLYNPCKELNDLLCKNNKNDYEVIDLARTDLNYKMLLQLIKESKQLEPDMIVIFGGNNWDCSDLWEGTPLEIADRMKKGGMKSVLDYFNEGLVEKVKKLYGYLDELFMKKGIPVVFVIPEFNLLDWKDTDIGLPWDKDTDHSKWLSYMKRLQKRLENHDYENVICEALENSDLNQKLSVWELNILAEAYRASGKNGEALECKRRAKDVAVLYPKISTPRTVTAVQEALRKEADNYKELMVVDCGEVFRRERTDIGREFFMDYCHLTMHGIQLVMREVFLKLAGTNHTYTELSAESKTDEEKNKRMIAEAHFLAAIHNAHWGQEKEIVRYHLQKACEGNAEIKNILKAFLFFQNRSLPVWMSKNAEAYLNGISEQRQRYLSKNNGLVLDKILTECMQEIISDVSFHKELEAESERIYGIHEKAKNLLDPDYYVNAISMLEAQYNWPEIPERLKRYGYYVAYSHHSKFCFVLDRPCSLELKMAGRIPESKCDVKAFRILLNGMIVYEGEITGEWSKFDLEMKNDYVTKGYNELQIQWPDYSDRSAEEIEKITEVLEARRTPEVLPVFGEIYTLTLKKRRSYE